METGNTIKLPKELVRKMENYPKVNWEDLITNFLENITEKFESLEANRIVKGGKLTEDDRKMIISEIEDCIN